MVESRENEAGAAVLQTLPKRRKHFSKKKRRQEVDEADEEGAQEEEVEGAEDEGSGDEGEQDDAADAKSGDEPPEGKGGRHIHPCVCDLTESAKRRVAAYTKAKSDMRQKFVLRKHQIEEELKQKELERLEREREKSEQKELFGDEYEMTEEGLRKRKKRSARRVSMVSLGVRQVINWKKEPRVPVKYNTVWKLRHDNTRYCAKRIFLVPCPEEIDWKREPAIPVRFTSGSKLRRDFNQVIKTKLIQMEDKRRPFVLHFIP